MTLIGATDRYTASMPGPLTSRRTFVATAAAAASMAAAGPASAATDTLVWDIAAGPQ